LGTGSVYKNFSYSETSNNYYYDFCGTTGSKNLHLSDISLQYRQNPDYPQRIWQPEDKIYNTTQTDQILYLLSINDGIYVTYQVLTSAGTPIQGVNVISTRVVSGETVIVGAGETDAAGLVTFWENPDFLHTTTFTHPDYETYTFSHYPSQNAYTITLGEAEEIEHACIKGISQTVKPSSNFLVENEIYDFNYTIVSTFWNLTGFGFTLIDENGANLGSNSSTSSSGGTLTLNNINISDAEKIIMNYYYILDPDEDEGNCGTISDRRVWIVQSTTGREYSIWQFAQNFNAYISAGLFGIDNFGKLLISFLIIILMVGGLSTKYGIASEEAIMGLLFGIVFILDVELGMIPRVEIGDIVSVDHFFTIVTFIMLLIVLLREAVR